MMSAASRPTGGRDSGAFSTLMASVGRLGTAPPAGVWPVSGQTGGGGGGAGDWLAAGGGVDVAEAVTLGAATFFDPPHAAPTRATAATTHAKRIACPLTCRADATLVVSSRNPRSVQAKPSSPTSGSAPWGLAECNGQSPGCAKTQTGDQRHSGVCPRWQPQGPGRPRASKACMRIFVIPLKHL